MKLSVVVRSLPRASPERCSAAVPPRRGTTSVEAHDDEAERCCAVAPPRKPRALFIAAAPPRKATINVEVNDDAAERCCAVAPPR